MKKPFNTILLSAIVLMSAVSLQTLNAQTNTFPATGSAGVGTTTPAASALLEVKSTTKGILIPRMSKTQRNALVSPAEGLLIYQNNTGKGFYYYNGSAWSAINNVKGLNNNLFIGYFAGDANVATATTGIGNIAIGKAAYALATDRIENIAIGDSSQYTLGSGTIGNQAWYNVSVGSKSQRYSTSGTKNTSVGAYSLYNTVAGNDNVALGYRAMYSNQYNHFCVAVGEDALYGSKGDNNTGCGYTAGSTAVFSTECSFFGDNADQNSSTSYTNSTALGSYATITDNSQVRVGNSSVTSIGGFANFTNVSDGRYKKEIKENVPGLEFINKLKPVTYHLDVRGLRTFLNEDRNSQNQTPEAKARIEKGIVDKEQILYSGFVAQDVERAAQETGYDFSGVDKPQNNESLYGLRYAEFTVPLVKAVQELSAANTSKDEKINSLQKENELLKSRLDKIEAALPNNLKQGNQQIINSALEQNNPNPFNQSTVIRYTLTEKSNNGKIIIRDLNGNLVKQVSIAQSGKGQVTINANELAQGTYTYTLEIAGESVDTKLMVVTK